MVKAAWPKIKKIFRLRMRSSTFPVISCSDLGRVMNDLGVLSPIKAGFAALKSIFDDQM
jgi:hypothetical protein